MIEMEIAQIHIGERARKDMGDLNALAASIREQGLLHPPAVTSDGLLIAGHRRIEACTSLGMTSIPVRILEPLVLRSVHQSQLPPSANKFHLGNGDDGKHYWLTPTDLFERLNEEFEFDFDPCPFPRPEDFDGLTCEWGKRNYVNPPFGSIMHQGPNDRKPKKKGPTAWMRKAIEEQAKGKLSVVVYPVDKWVLMMLKATNAVQVRNLGDVRWHAIEDGSAGKGTGRHIAAFVLYP